MNKIKQMIPSAVTLMNAVCGAGMIIFFLISETRSLQIVSAGILFIVAGWFFDMFDGLVARALNVVSKMGGELDSFSDAITFGLAPCMLTVYYSLAVGVNRNMLYLSIIIGLIYLVCAVLRLAKFNVLNENSNSGHLYFSGFPSPIAALLVCGTVGFMMFLKEKYNFDENTYQLLHVGMLVYILIVALAMLSNFTYADMPKHYMKGMKPWYHIIILVISGIFIPYKLLLFICFSFYLLSPCFNFLIKKISRDTKI